MFTPATPVHLHNFSIKPLISVYQITVKAYVTIKTVYAFIHHVYRQNESQK